MRGCSGISNDRANRTRTSWRASTTRIATPTPHPTLPIAGLGRFVRKCGDAAACRAILEIEAAALAGDLLIGVFPAGGWWKDHLKARAGTEIPYSVVITIDVGDVDLDVYSLVSARIPTEISVDAT